ncbi:MAG: hypothetical protein ACRCYQ_15580 [Nocardioides sp.]
MSEARERGGPHSTADRADALELRVHSKAPSEARERGGPHSTADRADALELRARGVR